jgi:hypothetical protein
VTERDLAQFFGGIRSRLNREARPYVTSFTRIHLDRFFRAARRHLDAFEKARFRRDKEEATGFNVFHFIEPDENRLSDVLAFLLDPKDSHGQGDIFLRLMFEQLGLVADAKRIQDATVRREAATHNILNSRRRMDIVVDAGAWLAIENKVDSPEQPEQVRDYLEHLHRSTRHSSVRAALIYLSPNGRPPESVSELQIEEIKASVKLHCWNYHVELRQWLESCHRGCAAPKICHFLSDLMAYIKENYQREPASEPEIEDYEE